MLIPITKLLVYGGTTYYVLGPLLQLSPEQLLAVSGLVGAALGLGVKDLFAAVVGGLVVVLERPYQVGDKVEMDGHYGEVTDIGLRSTRLVTPDDTAVAVPNDGAPEMQVAVDLHVHPEADYETAARIVEEALVTSRYVHLADGRPHTVLVRDGPAYRTVRGKAYVNDLREEFVFESDVTRRALAGFERAGIDPPAVEVAVESD
jgi:small-conductance mechanosensitive channel